MKPLDTIRDELTKALQERETLNRKIEALQQSARLLEPVYGQAGSGLVMAEMTRLNDIKNLGITAAVARILELNMHKDMTPPEIRDALVRTGFELVGDNPLASIHQVLKRLVARNTYYRAKEKDGQTVYKCDYDRWVFLHSSRENEGGDMLSWPL